jgi:hypothetical protein
VNESALDATVDAAVDHAWDATGEWRRVASQFTHRWREDPIRWLCRLDLATSDLLRVVQRLQEAVQKRLLS